MSSPEREKWKDTMDKEIRSIGCKWVYKQKVGVDGSVERGYSHQYGLDYDETFSHVARLESLQTLLALAVQYGLHVHQMDVTTAFLNRKLREHVYMDQPKGFVI